jgi:hypothetical protein
MINIQEDNKSILDLIQYVDIKIVGIIKQKKLSQAALQDLQNLYEGAINDWMEHNYLPDIEPDPRWEQEIQDNLMDILNYLNSL